MNRMTTTPGHHGGMPPPHQHQHHFQGGIGLARYGSAPGSFLAALADSVTRGGGGEAQQQQAAPGPAMSRFFSGESSGLTSCESSCQTVDGSLQRAYGGSGEIHVPPPAPAHQVGLAGHSPLLRHSSSPAGLLSRLMSDPHGNGNGMANGMGGGSTRGIGSYSHAAAAGGGNDAHRRLLSSQWSFSAQEMMPLISEMGMVIPDIGERITGGGGGCNSSSDGGGLSRNFSMSSWDDTNSIIFSSPPSSKKAKAVVNADDGMVTSFNNIVDSQFGLSSSSLDMPGGGMDDYLQLQQDSVACRARAKRGCATHPRSIAERERRTRISKRLKRLQDLVPNMDTQTNTSDMLDIAVDYIKVLQEQIEKLKQEKANCSCSASQN